MPELSNPATGRARRHAVQMPLLYRPAESDAWHTGQTVNLSGSGILFRGRHRVAAKAPLDLSLELPRALTGEASVTLQCTARVVRDLTSFFSLGYWTYGAAFLSCRVLHPAADVGEAPRTASLRHRGNNLLSVIAGNTELILMRDDLDDAVRDAARRIRSASEELAALLRQVMPSPPPGMGGRP